MEKTSPSQNHCNQTNFIVFNYESNDNKSRSRLAHEKPKESKGKLQKTVY